MLRCKVAQLQQRPRAAHDAHFAEREFCRGDRSGDPTGDFADRFRFEGR